MKFLSKALLVFLLISNFAHSQNYIIDESKIRNDDPVISMLDSLQFSAAFESINFTCDTSKLNIFNYCPDLVPMFSDQVYEARLKLLDEKSPFDLVFNPAVKTYIDVYAIRKRALVSRVLGLSHLYFPMFEEELDRYNLPIEFKYLAIVESALNPIAVSRSGAGGLWQFMYPTGKMFGLNQDSYTDERKDPYESTKAACKYVKYLYGMFGDWQMVLAAYNCGPGTVNKAIRRSGGKKTYWEIRPYLPLETQNYVPAFIAVNYVMNYSKEHNLYPISPKKEFFFADTVKLASRTDLKHVANVLQMNIDDLKFLNPKYKTTAIPFDHENSILCLPATKVGAFISNQEFIYNLSKENINIAYKSTTNIKGNSVSKLPSYHNVKKGEGLASIAKKYHCTAAEIKSWNKLKSNKVSPGKKLIIYTENSLATTVSKPKTTYTTVVYDNGAPAIGNLDFSDNNTQTTDSISESNVISSSVLKTDANVQHNQTDKQTELFYVVQRGDTLWKIANRYNGLTVEELKRANQISDNKSLKLGTKLKIPLKS
jgi:membrane-bound lytic murein transglycosylase D